MLFATALSCRKHPPSLCLDTKLNEIVAINGIHHPRQGGFLPEINWLYDCFGVEHDELVSIPSRAFPSI